MERMQYDGDWIVAYAMALEQRAQRMIFRAWVIAVSIGAIGAMALYATNKEINIAALFLVAIGVLFLGAILASFAASKAAMLRLQAHTALCQVQIEKNTRPQ
jgi:hypothetical protein